MNYINIKYYLIRMLLIKDGDPDTHARIHFLMDHTQVFLKLLLIQIWNDDAIISRNIGIILDADFFLWT